MAQFKFKVMVDEARYTTAKLGTGVVGTGDLNNNDVGKPVKLIAADTYGLCSDGDAIDGFLNSVEDYVTDDNYAVGTVQLTGRRRVKLSGAAAVGTLVEAAANGARTVKDASGLGLVSVRTIDTTSAATLAATLPTKKWKVISGTGLDADTTAIVELQ